MNSLIRRGTRPLTLLAALALVGAVGAVGAAAAYTTWTDPSPDDGPPPLPAVAPAHPVGLISATAFTLEQPVVHVWCAEQPSYDAGLVLVLRVPEREMLHPRQTAEPVLYAGDMPLERVNQGYGSGRLVAILPSPRDEQGRPALAGAERALFLGDPALPEAVTAQQAREQLARALAAGVPESRLTTDGSEPLPFPDQGELLAWCATLVAAYAPDEVDLVRGLTVPRLRR